MDAQLQKQIEFYARTTRRDAADILYAPFGSFPSEMEEMSGRERSAYAKLIATCMDSENNAYSLFLKVKPRENVESTTTNSATTIGE